MFFSTPLTCYPIESALSGESVFFLAGIWLFVQVHIYVLVFANLLVYPCVMSMCVCTWVVFCVEKRRFIYTYLLDCIMYVYSV